MTKVSKNLGLVSAIHVGTTAPSNIYQLWYNLSDGLHYSFDILLEQWVSLVSTGAADVLVQTNSLDTTPDYLYNKFIDNSDVIRLIDDVAGNLKLSLLLQSQNKPYVTNPNPIVTDDDSTPYKHRIGQIFLAQTSGNVYIARSLTTGAAVWDRLAKFSDISAADGNGIYDGSGVVPTTTVVTLTDSIAFNGANTTFSTQNGYWQGAAKILYINPNATTGNLFVGEDSGNGTIVGIGNIGIGYQSLKNNTLGITNTAIGYSSLSANTTGSGCVAIGYEAGLYNTVDSNQLFIHNGLGVTNLATSKSNSIIYGLMDATATNQTLRFNAKVGIGQAAGSNVLSMLTSGVLGMDIGNGIYTVNLLPNGTSTLTELNTTNIGFQFGSTDGYYRLNRTAGSGSALIYTNGTATSLALSGATAGTVHMDISSSGMIAVTEHINQSIGAAVGSAKFHYIAASSTADTIGDSRSYSTYSGGITTHFIEKCTVANAAKGGGTWVVINNNYFFAASDETSSLIADAVNAAYTDYLPYAMTVQAVMINVNTAPTDANIIVDIHKNGVTIFTTLISIDATENTSLTATTPYVLDGTITFAQGDKLEAFITQVGNTVAGTGLKVKLL